MAAVTDRDRWLALALLLAALLLGYLLLVHPWWTVPMQRVGADIDAMQQRELRARMQLQQADEVASRLQEAQALEARMPSFLREDSAELATASLIQRLETVVAQASPGNRSCAISNRTPTSTRQGQEPFERVTVHVRIRCGNPELASVLHALEGDAPRLFIDNLSIISQGFFSMPGRRAAGRQYGLDVEFDLYGYLKPRPAAAAIPAGGDTDAP